MSQKTTHSSSAPQAPRWVKALGIVAIAVILLFIGIHLMGYGFGHHGNHAQSFRVVAREVQSL